MGIPIYYLFFKKKEEQKVKELGTEEDSDKKPEEDTEEKNPEENKPPINKFLLAIPAFTDTCSTGLANMPWYPFSAPNQISAFKYKAGNDPVTNPKIP